MQSAPCWDRRNRFRPGVHLYSPVIYSVVDRTVKVRLARSRASFRELSVGASLIKIHSAVIGGPCVTRADLRDGCGVPPSATSPSETVFKSEKCRKGKRNPFYIFFNTGKVDTIKGDDAREFALRMEWRELVSRISNNEILMRQFGKRPPIFTRRAAPPPAGRQLVESAE